MSLWLLVCFIVLSKHVGSWRINRIKNVLSKFLVRSLVASDVAQIQETVGLVPLVTGFYSEISVENPVGPVVRSLCVARDELLHLIKADVALSVQQHMRIEYLSKVLEKCHIPIQTVPFYNLATQGCWRQVYSNVLLRKPVPQMRCNLTQTILPAEAASLSGSLVNSVFYSYDVPGVQVYTGKLDVQCEYACNSRGEVQVTLQGHVMLADDHVPEDTEGFLLDLQRSVPYDTFDPSNSTQKLLFVDPELKVVRVKSSQMVNVLNIFRRS